MALLKPEILCIAVFGLLSLSMIPKGFAAGPTTYQTWLINTVGDIVTLLPIGDISGDGVSEVVILSQDKVIYAADGVTGRTIWRNSADSFYPWLAAITSPSLHAGADSKSDVLVATKNGFVLSLDDSTGEQLWNFTNKNTNGYKYGDTCYPQVRSIRLISDIDNDGLPDLVIVSGSGDQCLKDDEITAVALGTKNGQKIWEFIYDEDYHGLKDGNKDGSPTCVIDINKDGVEDVLITDDKGILYVIDGSNGKLQSSNKIPISGAIWSLVALPDITGDGVQDALGLEFIDDKGGPAYARIDAMDVASDKIIWQIKLGDGLYQSGALYSALWLKDKTGTQSEEIRILVTQRFESERSLVLLDAKTGNQLWQLSLGGDVGGDDFKKYFAVAVIPDMNGNGHDELALGKTDSNLYLMDVSDASTIWSYSLGGQATTINFLSTDTGQEYIVAGTTRAQVIALAGLTSIPTKVTIEASESSVTPASKIVISGTVSPSFPGEFVQLIYIDPTGAAMTRPLILASDSTYTDTIKPEMLGTWKVSVEFKAEGFYVDSASQTSFSVVTEKKNSVFDLQVESDDKTKVSYPISYLMDGGKITSMSVNKDQNSISISTDPSSASAGGGTLRLELPKSVIDTWQPEFRVFIDGKNDLSFQELPSNDAQTRILSIPLSSGQHEIEITGTYVVPEFSAAGLGILTITIVAMLTVFKTMNLRIRPAKS